MTQKQMSYILSLMNKKNISEISGYEEDMNDVRNGREISKYNASKLIEYLLTCEDKNEFVSYKKQEKTSDWSVGEKMNHSKFGIGKINSIDGEVITINFETEGTKKLNINFIKKSFKM